MIKTDPIPVSSRAKALIFDCDGTLADTMPLHWEAWQTTFREYGYSCTREFMEPFMGVPAVTILETYNRVHGTNINPREFTAKKNKRAADMIGGAQPIIPVVSIVRRYHRRLPMAVASGGTRANVECTLATIGLTDMFVTVLTADDDVAPKPSPGIFLEAARRLKTTPQDCQVFEDGEPGLVAARLAGMIVTDVRPFLDQTGTTVSPNAHQPLNHRQRSD